MNSPPHPSFRIANLRRLPSKAKLRRGATPRNGRCNSHTLLIWTLRKCSFQEKDFPKLFRRRLLKKSEIKAFAYKIMRMEFFDRSILSIEIAKTDFFSNLI
jgi:hypothetical protein